MKTMNMTFKKVVLLGLMISQLGTISCSGQDKVEENTIAASEKPDIRYKIDKEYDSKGNLIRYDSTYSYRSKSGNMNDSLFNEFMGKFKEPFFNPFENSELRLLNDSNLFQPFNNDPFFEHFKEQNKIFEEWNEEIRKRNQFFYKQFSVPQSLPEKQDEKTKRS